MPDISLRFQKDMLVLSAPIAAALSRQGVDAAYDLEYLNLVEPEAVHNALRMESIAGAQCLVANTEGITSARLTHRGMQDNQKELAQTSLDAVRKLKPQHILVEIGPCGLPLDGSSMASLNENRDQYANAARLFEGEVFDAFLLNGFTKAADLKCALMGVRKVSDQPLFASVEVDAQGMLLGTSVSLEEAFALMEEYGASVAGFATKAPIEQACALAARACAVVSLPVMVSLHVAEHAPKQGGATPENPYYCPDVMIDAATQLRGVGAQFLRAIGAATPVYTGALAAASDGFDVIIERESC